ncbi:MAG: hypothetical protein ACE5HS_12480 [bacterium]
MSKNEQKQDVSFYELEDVRKNRPATKELHFESGYHSIKVHLEIIPGSGRGSEQLADVSFPKQFDVEIIARDCLRRQITWRVDWRF